MGKHHKKFWSHQDAVTLTNAPEPFVMCWARKGAKSSTMEMGVVESICRGKRRYWLYGGETQNQSDDHVTTIASLLESDKVEQYYPQHSDRKVGKFGNVKGWRRNRLVTAGGAIVDAVGLESAFRGLKFEDLVPDAVALDDFDGDFDTLLTTTKKLRTIRNKLLGATQDNAYIILGQNKILPNGVMAKVLSGVTDFLLNRVVSGPVPAIEKMKIKRVLDESLGRIRHIIVGGRPTWEGQSIEKCQRLIDRMGLETFLQEQQHEVEEREGALWTRDEINITRVDASALPMDETGIPAFVRVVVGVDPSGGSDDIGIIVGGLGYDGDCYILADRTQAGRLGPEVWGYETVRAYEEYSCDHVVAEANYGGDMVSSNIGVHSKNIPVKLVTATRGKAVRAEPVKSLYAKERVHHVGNFPELETEMTSWVPGETRQSPNRLDALVWVVTELLLEPEDGFSGRMVEIRSRRR